MQEDKRDQHQCCCRDQRRLPQPLILDERSDDRQVPRAGDDWDIRIGVHATLQSQLGRQLNAFFVSARSVQIDPGEFLQDAWIVFESLGDVPQFCDSLFQADKLRLCFEVVPAQI